jgi:hypothetical protein
MALRRVTDAHYCSRTAGSWAWPAHIEANDDSRAALQALTAGHTLRLESLGDAHDRYGRVVAFAFANDSQQSVEQAMLDQGRARVSARVGDKACADGLLSAERTARGRPRALGRSQFRPFVGGKSAPPTNCAGQFALVEDNVLSVRESGATIYVNFGRRWTRDFTVIILRRLGKAFTTAGVEPKKLEGRRIRVRGWIEQRGGPIITAEAPEQIEVLD